MESFRAMKSDHVGRIIFDEDDVVNMVMRGQSLTNLNGLLVQPAIDLESAALILEDIPKFIDYDKLAQETLEEFDHRCRNTWHMPEGVCDLNLERHFNSIV